jgi:hypothetical protein
MTNLRMGNVAWALAVAALATGCAPLVPRVDCAAGQYSGFDSWQAWPETPRLDCAFGESVNTAIAQQTIDKNAGAKNAAKDAAGIDGVAAREALVRYQKSFRTPEPTPSVFSIGVSGGSGGMSSGGGQ